jgi:hypothetical protein
MTSWDRLSTRAILNTVYYLGAILPVTPMRLSRSYEIWPISASMTAPVLMIVTPPFLLTRHNVTTAFPNVNYHDLIVTSNVQIRTSYRTNTSAEAIQ